MHTAVFAAHCLQQLPVYLRNERCMLYQPPTTVHKIARKIGLLQSVVISKHRVPFNRTKDRELRIIMYQKVFLTNRELNAQRFRKEMEPNALAIRKAQ